MAESINRHSACQKSWRYWLAGLLMFACVTDSSLFAAQGTVDPQAESFWNEYFTGYSLPEQVFPLMNAGQSIFVDYSLYGEFQNAGQQNYRYIIKNEKRLKAAVGEGIYPNIDVYKDPRYRKMKKRGLLKGSPWRYVHSKDFEKAFFIWAQGKEDPGVRLFFTAKIFEKAGLMEQAIKAYYAAVVHFPRSEAWAVDHTFIWYIAPTAISSIERLCRDYAGLNCELQGASFDIQQADSADSGHALIQVNPGKIVRKTVAEKIRDIKIPNPADIVESRGAGLVRLVKYATGEWQMLVEGAPYFVKGVTYAPTEVGLGPDKDFNFDARWMFTDKNNNGLIDAPYEAWVDNDSIAGRHQPVGDFALLQKMGINTIRIYAPSSSAGRYAPHLINKPLLRDMYRRFGIRVMMGDFLGAYTIGSGASWDRGTDYTDPRQRARMKEIVRDKVMDLKGEPFVLMWVLGSENNLPANYRGVNASRTNAASQPEAYARFINEVAEMIHEIDGDHPVAIGNLELGLIDYYKKYAPAIDILGVNSYRGADGFGALFHDARKRLDKPVLITEYGCDAYTEAQGPDEESQLKYLQGNLRDILYNMPGGPGEGNAIGGVVFEYLDEWWKAPHTSYGHQATAHQQTGQSPDGYVHEEWFGIVGQGRGHDSPFGRHLRKAYFYFKDIFDKLPKN
ncbi:MAG: glycoside hydrolase family 2 TIM barrel-domain containing protein [Candidatus Omnitrophota bacterium]